MIKATFLYLNRAEFEKIFNFKSEAIAFYHESANDFGCTPQGLKLEPNLILLQK